MKYNFDEVIDRRGTGSFRWDVLRKNYNEPDMIPLTTADMDFRVAPEISKAIIQQAGFGVYGYIQPKPSYYEAVQERLAKHASWNVEKEWISYSAGIVGAIAYCIQGMTEPGDGVVLLTPIYHPFSHIIENNGRVVKRCVLKQSEDRAFINYEDLESILAQEDTKMIVFCNPHNPIGCVWTEEEITKVSELCLKHNVIMISDEIHCEIVFSGHTFTSAGTVMKKLNGLNHLVVCCAASKTFNIPGLQCSAVIIPDKELRGKYSQILMRSHYMEMNAVGPVATEAAYRYGDEWLKEALTYLEENRDYVTEYINSRIPGLHAVKPEATYMIWIDCRQLGKTEAELEDLFYHKAKVGLNLGSTFGPGGEGFVRMNFAEPHSVLTEVLERIEKAVKQ